MSTEIQKDEINDEENALKTLSKTILLASFIRRKDLEKSIQQLSTHENIYKNRIFVLRETQSKNKLILTYNIDVSDNDKINFDDYLRNTIAIHRKRESNTLYTLNALNEVVKLENDQELNKDFKINWESYRNCLLITSKAHGLTKIETILESIEEF
jgi:hypothetical protein